MAKNQKMVSVFAPRIICGEEVEPFCMPNTERVTDQLISAGTNLIWWAMHEALADGKVEEARQIGKMLVDIVGRELTVEAKNEACELIDEIIERYTNLPDGPLN